MVLMPTKKKSLYSSGRVTAKKKPNKVDHKVCLDPVLAGRVLDLSRKREELLSRLKHDPSVGSQVEGVTEELEEAKDEARAETIHFVAISIGRKPWEQLKKDHPPTKEQKKELQDAGFNRQASFNPDTFAPVCFAAALKVAIAWNEEGNATELRDLDDEEITDILEGKDWNDAEQGDLLTACLIANESAPRVDLGNG
jgi:hypothetical protein